MARPPTIRKSAFAIAAMILAFTCVEAFAHASEGGHVLLLPTGYYMAGGAVAVALSFLVLIAIPAGPLDAAARGRLGFVEFSTGWRGVVSLLSFVVFAILVAAGFLGSRDPLSNPLPLTVWTLIWVGLTLLHGLFGDFWSWINPWYGPWRIAMRLTGRSGDPRPALRLPGMVGQWPAAMLFFGFAWFQLVDTAPQDAARLAGLLAAYWIFTFAGICLFGYQPWTRRVEFLSLFLSTISRLSVFASRGGQERQRLFLCLPGAKAAGSPPRWPSGVCFILLALSSVSFDGFQRTFFWLGHIGVNPLDFPGRSALVWPDTLGLIGMFLALAALFYSCVWLGGRIAGGDVPLGKAAGLLIWSIVPISMAYHFAHYLTELLVNAQYALVSISDPFDRGWNLFGTAHIHVHAGVVLGAGNAWIIWNAQAIAIVAGHMLAILVAHVIAYLLHGTSRKATLSQLPLAVLMIGYTVFGLWLLATPAAG